MIAPRKLVIHISPESDQQLVRIQDTGSLPLCAFMAGKTLGEATNAMGLLYQVCRGAQAVTCRLAAESALGIEPSSHIQEMRSSLIALEALHEHLWKLLVDLPRALKLPHSSAEVAPIFQSLRAMINVRYVQCEAQHADEREGDGIVLPAVLKDAIHEQLFAPNHAIAEALKSHVSELDWHPRIQLDALPNKMKIIPDDTVSDKPVATGPWARQFANQNSIATSSQGDGILVQCLNALLTEVLTLLSHKPGITIKADRDETETNTGWGQVETARGRLTQKLSLTFNTDGEPLVKSLSMISPTDWNFHPRGPAVKLLTNLIEHGHESLWERAEVLVQLLNPCCAYQLHCSLDQNSGVAAYA